MAVARIDRPHRLKNLTKPKCVAQLPVVLVPLNAGVVAVHYANEAGSILFQNKREFTFIMRIRGGISIVGFFIHFIIM